MERVDKERATLDWEEDVLTFKSWDLVLYLFEEWEVVVLIFGDTDGDKREDRACLTEKEPLLCEDDAILFPCSFLVLLIND